MSLYCPKCDKHITNVPASMEATYKCFEDGCEATPDWKIFAKAKAAIGNGRDPLLVERQKTHGDFRKNAKVSQSLKRMIHVISDEPLCDVHREAIDMMCLKLSRILSGQANFKDHWDDIAGYAKLASEACNNDNRGGVG